MANGINVKLPMVLDPDDGIKLNKTFEAAIRQNFINLLFTIKGERVMIPEFGVGLSTFLFEQDTIQTRQDIIERIREQLSNYLPVVELEEIKFLSQKDDSSLRPHFLYMRIQYRIKPLDAIDSLIVAADEINLTVDIQDDDIISFV
jgi:phage baseplate assembly protein W